MQVLFVAVFSQNSTNCWQADAFDDVLRYDYRARAKEIGQTARDQEIVETCKTHRPKITLFAKCNGVHENVLARCRKYSTVVLWMPDDRNNINEEFPAKMHQADHIFGSNYDVIKAGNVIGKQVKFLPGGFDPNLHRPINTPYKFDVSFIGSLHNAIRKEYSKYVDIKQFHGVYGLTHSAVVNASRINLNFNNGAGTSNRTYKILAAGGFLLTQPWHRHDKMFKDAFDTFCTPFELEEKVKYYLSHPQERQEIAANGLEQVQQYDNFNYAKNILEVL